MRLGPTLLLPVLLCTALLTACEDEPEPKIVEPTSTAPPTTTATTSSAVPTTSVPTTSVPTTSAPPKGETAKQFVIRFQAEAGLMKSTGETDRYRALSPRCSDCANLADAVEDVYADGGRIVGKTPRTTKVHQVGKVRDVSILEFDYVAPPSKLLDGHGKVTTRFPGGTVRFQINVSRVAGAWQVLRLSELVS